VGKRTEIPVVWLQGATDSGCSVSVVNATWPSARNLLLEEVVPGKHINLRFQATIMAGSGDPVIDVLRDTAKEAAGSYLFILEGAVPTKDGGLYCAVGEDGDKPIPVMEHVKNLASSALACIALGTCASYGGIFAGSPNPTGCKGLSEVLADAGIDTPVINIPGCPPHPDWFVGTVARIMLGGLPGPEEIDEVGRPLEFYGSLIHENCPRRADFDAGKFAKKPGDPGCLYLLGCKGPQTSADCPLRQWNGGVNWCVKSGGGCHGCVEPEFPDKVSPMYEKVDEERLAQYRIRVRN